MQVLICSHQNFKEVITAMFAMTSVQQPSGLDLLTDLPLDKIAAIS